tara:strand:- start:4936 stop:5829 length:894 start_codon:yes stop_codon:yes gene_type:complete
MNLQRLSGFVRLIAALAIPTGLHAAPITSNSALPVGEDELLVRVQANYLQTGSDPSGLGRKASVWAYPTVFVYGAGERLTLFGVLPFLEKNLDQAGRTRRGDSGLGDVRVLARYTLAQRDQPGETLRLGAFAGLELPSGENGARDELGELPAPLQLGSGSWDPIAGSVFTWQTLQWQLDASASWKFNTQADGYEFGDEARLDLSFQYRLWPRELGAGVPGFFYAVLESNLVWRDRDRDFGGLVGDSGGFQWFLGPGLQYVTQRWIAEAAVQIPVAQNLNGNSLENEFMATAGIRFWY